ncbi:hypothetical protein MOO45_04075 [Bombilactobacillus folatiphilus]|uniref:Uncharacterized protein n=1 Tax=Bombilactobacillus folatiphilus TaxID=2923362 RepID=A0ABY4PB04_9LACO|nr:hypothetical protein [Bombilactobacillus folatiphilus]UQS82826.1 hypothetical protein MOO45_04075 [Bombilactobacillus folatiphilus]
MVIYAVFVGVLVLFRHQFTAINHIFEFIQNLTNGNLTSIILLDGVFIFFGVALFLLVSSFAGIGVTKQEDISKVSTPVGLIVMVLYMATIWTLTLAKPINYVTKILSVLPFTSSFFLPIWVSTEAVPIWIILAAIILAVGTIILLSWVFSQLYQILALYKGSKPIKYAFKHFLKQ